MVVETCTAGNALKYSRKGGATQSTALGAEQQGLLTT